MSQDDVRLSGHNFTQIQKIDQKNELNRNQILDINKNMCQNESVSGNHKVILTVDEKVRIEV